MIIVPVPNRIEMTYVEYKDYSGIFRALNGHDLLWLQELKFDLGNSNAVFELLTRLQFNSTIDIAELDLEDFVILTKAICNKLLNKNLITPECWFELVFIANGKSFCHDWEKWLDVPIPVLIGMGEIAKKYLQSF